MSNVLVDKYKIDLLANAIANKSDESVTMTLSGMVQAVDSIETVNDLQSRSASDLIATGDTVIVPSGYYETEARKAVQSGEAVAPASISATGASHSAGSNKLTLWKSIYVQPDVEPGYVREGTATAANVSLQANIPTLAAQTVHPSTSDTIIASGKYISGTQTIKGVTTTNLSAENIKDGVTVKIGDSTDDDCVTSVTGTYSSGGITPSGTYSITSNGTYDVTQYASADVNVSGGGASLKPIVLRPDAELVQRWTYDKYIVADEEITIPAYTTTSTTLKASESLSPSITADTANYSYYFVFRGLTIPEYNTTSKGVGRTEYYMRSVVTEISTIPATTIKSINKVASFTNWRNLVQTSDENILVYYNSSNAISTVSGDSYGTTQNYVEPSSTNALTGTPTYTFKSPNFRIRGNKNYFTSTYFGALTDIRNQYIIEVWRVPNSSISSDGWQSHQNFYRLIDCVNSADHTLT